LIGGPQKNLYKVLKTKVVQKDSDGAKASGSAEAVSEMDTRMSDVCSEMEDTTPRANKAEEEAGKADEALMRAGQDARRSCLGLRAKRAGQGSTEARNDDEEAVEDKNDRAAATNASGCRRRREELNDQKDEELVALVKKNNDEEIRQVELRRCAAEERRYCWRNSHWSGAREKHQEEVTKPVSNEAT